MARHFEKNRMAYSEINDFLEEKAKHLKNVTPFYVTNVGFGDVAVHYFYDDKEED
jgi:hypothetical protein